MRRVVGGIALVLSLGVAACARCGPCVGGGAPACRVAGAPAAPAASKGVVEVEIVVLPADAEARATTTVEFVDAAAAAAMRASRKVTSAPRITVVEGERASVTMADSVSYVDSFEVEKAGGAAIANPIIATAAEGFAFDVTATPSAAAGRYEVDLAVRTRALDRPMATESVDLGVGPPVVVQRPRMTLGGIETRLQVPDGGWVLVRGLSGPASARSLLFRVSRSPIVIPPGVTPEAYFAPSNFVPPAEDARGGSPIR